jgi:hypothetical protein
VPEVVVILEAGHSAVVDEIPALRAAATPSRGLSIPLTSPTGSASGISAPGPSPTTTISDAGYVWKHTVDRGREVLRATTRRSNDSELEHSDRVAPQLMALTSRDCRLEAFVSTGAAAVFCQPNALT